MKRALFFMLCCLGGCADYDRDYSGSYDVTDQRYSAGITIRPASQPGSGSRSLSLGVTGDGKEFIR